MDSARLRPFGDLPYPEIAYSEPPSSPITSDGSAESSDSDITEPNSSFRLVPAIWSSEEIR